MTPLSLFSLKIVFPSVHIIRSSIHRYDLRSPFFFFVSSFFPSHGSSMCYLAYIHIWQFPLTLNPSRIRQFQPKSDSCILRYKLSTKIWSNLDLYQKCCSARAGFAGLLRGYNFSGNSVGAPHSRTLCAYQTRPEVKICKQFSSTIEWEHERSWYEALVCAFEVKFMLSYISVLIPLFLTRSRVRSPSPARCISCSPPTHLPRLGDRKDPPRFKRIGCIWAQGCNRDTWRHATWGQTASGQATRG